MSAVATTRRPPPWRNVRVLRVVFQAAFLAVVVFLVWTLLSTLVGNLENRGIRTDFGFLDQPSGFAIPDSDFRSSQPISDALVVGAKNTLVVSGVGILLATILGIVVGVARLSPNWLVRRAAALYVESLRNIPVLVIIFFWYLAVLLRLPPISRAVEWGNVFVLSNRGVVVPKLVGTGDLTVLWIVLGVGAVASLAAARWRTRRFDRTGEPHRRVLWASGVLAAAFVVAFFAAGQPLGFSLPERGDLGTRNGFRLTIEFAALLIALALYTASHIAEIVRGAILAVHRGQSEAADALGLSDFQRLRHVVLPQALRIMIPPLANQYLNLTKNSSLAVAIGYYEVTRVTRIAISQAAPAPQAIAILMGIYLLFSLTIAAVTNVINRRSALKGR